MRYMLTATMAASVLAIGLKIDPAVSLPLGGTATGPDSAIENVQDKGGGGGGGPGGGGGGGRGGGGPAAGGGGGGGGPAAGGRGDGGGGAMRGGGGGGGMREGGGMRQGGGGMREGGAQFRQREDGGTRFRAERGVRRDRDRADVYVDRDRDRRRFRRGVIIDGGYGYIPASCDWLRLRALATDSAYWWRRYRACQGY